jgi:hypothetical protein
VVREVVLLDDGSALLALPGRYDGAVTVEIVGQPTNENLGG